MENEYETKNIDKLEISGKAIELLKSRQITKLSQLANKTRSELKGLGLENYEINKIDIELQLIGLSLKGSL